MTRKPGSYSGLEVGIAKVIRNGFILALLPNNGLGGKRMNT
jgi:hypothetical protein